MLVVRTAQPAEERAAARGLPFNAQELVEQAKRHYSDIKEKHQRWRDNRRRDKERTYLAPQGTARLRGAATRTLLTRPATRVRRSGCGLHRVAVDQRDFRAAGRRLRDYAGLVDDHGRNLWDGACRWTSRRGRRSSRWSRFTRWSPCPCGLFGTHPTKRWVRAAGGSCSGTACCGWPSWSWPGGSLAYYVPGVSDFFRDLFHDWRDVTFDVARTIAAAG